MSDEIVLAILAAGASRRLGQPKQLVLHQGEPLVRRQCRIAIEASIGPVVVVLGCQHEQVAPLIADLPVKILINLDWPEGMASSVRTATRCAIDLQSQALLLLHGDQYAIQPADLIHLHDSWRVDPASACLARAGDHLGPPAILPARLFSGMLTLQGDTGPRALLQSDPRVVEVPIASASRDVDLPVDLLTSAPKQHTS